MAKGTVKWFNDAKGFGFITPADGGKDLFAHHSELQMSGFKSLKEGQQVEYEPINGQKGPAASKIREIYASAAVATRHGRQGLCPFESVTATDSNLGRSA